MEVTVIKADCREKKRLRVAAYCRVSSENDEQVSSIENQVAHYKALIEKTPDYEYAGIYYDQGVSGFVESRPGFQNLMTDAKAGKIDLVITKSITRFARNTDTLLKAVRELKEQGIGVFFELQHINTLESSGELMLTVVGAFAQAESENYRQLSQMVYARKYQAGIPVQYLEKSFGYMLDEDGNILAERDSETRILK